MIVLFVPSCGTIVDEQADRPASEDRDNADRADQADQNDESGNDDQRDGSGDSPSDEPLDPGDPEEPGKPGEPGDPGKPEEPGDPKNLISIRWVEREPDRSHTLRVHYELPTPCSPGLQDAVVDEDATEVRIALHREPDPKKDDDTECAQVIVEESTTVQLDEPLDGRDVIDAKSSEPLRLGE